MDKFAWPFWTKLQDGICPPGKLHSIKQPTGVRNADDPLQTFTNAIILVWSIRTNTDKEERRMSLTMDQIHRIRQLYYEQGQHNCFHPTFLHIFSNVYNKNRQTWQKGTLTPFQNPMVIHHRNIQMSRKTQKGRNQASLLSVTPTTITCQAPFAPFPWSPTYHSTLRYYFISTWFSRGCSRMNLPPTLIPPHRHCPERRKLRREQAALRINCGKLMSDWICGLSW
jgi:hypothetical protein